MSIVSPKEVWKYPSGNKQAEHRCTKAAIEEQQHPDSIVPVIPGEQVELFGVEVVNPDASVVVLREGGRLYPVKVTNRTAVEVARHLQNWRNCSIMDMKAQDRLAKAASRKGKSRKSTTASRSKSSSI